ncbi:MAG: MauE/DoxX family redox-associated membrane protein [Verrucomicrobiota bacterium]
MKTWIGHIFSAIIGVFFVWAGTLKVLEVPEFYQSVLHYQLIDGWAAWAVALVIPNLEIVAGLALIVPRLRFGGFSLLTLLLLIFQAGLLSAWFRELNIDCGCLGEESSSIPYALTRNLFLLAGLVVIYFISLTKKIHPHD